MRLYQRFICTAARFVESVEMSGEIPALSGVGVFCRPLGRNPSETEKRQLSVMRFGSTNAKGTVAAVRRVIETLGYSMTPVSGGRLPTLPGLSALRLTFTISASLSR